MTVIRIAKNWDWPDLFRQTACGQGQWNGIRFTLDDEEECDALVILNNRLTRDLQVRCPEDRVWVLMQEPYCWGMTDWMVERLAAVDRVYTNYLPGPDPKFRRSQPALPWHVNRSFDELVGAAVPEKTRPLSWVAGNCRDLPGHITRANFFQAVREQRDIDIDLYGRAIRFIEDKGEGLAPYRYSIAAENTAWPDYWTEKIADCFLTWTVPLYYGCPNLEEYFPADSFIRIDIAKPAEALATIRRTLAEDDWERRLPALAEARRRVLYEYQIFPYLSSLLLAEPAPPAGPYAVRTVPAYRRTVATRIRRAVYKVHQACRRAVPR